VQEQLRKFVVAEIHELHAYPIVRSPIQNFHIHCVRGAKIGFDNRHPHPLSDGHKDERIWIGGDNQHATPASLRNRPEPITAIVHSDGPFRELEAFELTAIRDVNHDLNVVS
jgi:hypothetical protein